METLPNIPGIYLRVDLDKRTIMVGRAKNMMFAAHRLNKQGRNTRFVLVVASRDSRVLLDNYIKAVRYARNRKDLTYVKNSQPLWYEFREHLSAPL